jgi:hypothetical protein
MSKNKKIGILTKFLSQRNYISEVSVDGKKNVKFHYKLGFFDLYVSQIIRTGNGISLLTNQMSITGESFWITNHFEDVAKFVFWTFNRSFLLKIIEDIQTKKLPVLTRIHKLLIENPVAYRDPIPEKADEELLFCYRKKESMKKDSKFEQMFSLDQQNRAEFLLAVEKRISEFPSPLPTPEEDSQAAPTPEESAEPQASPARTILFLEVLRPMDGSPENTLQFIIEKTDQAGFPFKIFQAVPRLENGKNQYGLNGCIAAMIDFFYQLDYFKKEYSLEEIFKAFLQYSGNSIGKLHTFLSEFREDKYFTKFLPKLKNLKINKLS